MYVIITASMKRVQSRTAEKKWRHRFSHYKPMGIFSDVQGQLTPQSMVQSGQNSNSAELSYMSLFPASMEMNGWKTAEKKWRHRFSHHNPICYHGNQWSDLAECRTHPSSHASYHYMQVWKVPDQEQRRKIPNDASEKIWLRSTHWFQRYPCLKVGGALA